MVLVERWESWKYQKTAKWCPAHVTMKVLIENRSLGKYDTVCGGPAMTGSLSEGRAMTGTGDYLIMRFSAHIRQSNIAFGRFALGCSQRCALRRSWVNDPDGLVTHKDRLLSE